jgi:hypothetical protein
LGCGGVGYAVRFPPRPGEKAQLTPKDALNEQIARYRRMTGEERLAIALRLHELACQVACEGIRHQHPAATPDQVEQYLRRRLEMARCQDE